VRVEVEGERASESHQCDHVDGWLVMNAHEMRSSDERAFLSCTSMELGVTAWIANRAWAFLAGVERIG